MTTATSDTNAEAIFRRVVSDAVDQYEDDADAAHDVIREMSTTDLEDWAMPIIKDECRRIRRAKVRETERRARRGGGSGRSNGKEATDPAADRAEWLRAGFTLSDHRRVTWGEATVEEHQDRRDYLDEYRRSYDPIIAQHDHSIQLIEAAGVACLNEVPGIEEMEL